MNNQTQGSVSDKLAHSTPLTQEANPQFAQQQRVQTTARNPYRRQAPDMARQQAENTRRQQLAAQAEALLARDPKAVAALRSAPKVVPAAMNTRAPVDRLEAIKMLGLYRKSVKMQPVISGYTPQKVSKPIVFAYQPGQDVTKLSRSVSREWAQILTSVSSASLNGGKLDGSQGRNLIRIIEELRKHCYLEMNEDGSPKQIREQVMQVVDGGMFCFAHQCCMSARTFYRALQHPLAHVFLRTQKVQRQDAGGKAQVNCATLFSVALYEPLIPPDLEAAFWSEDVEQDGVFVVPDYTCQTVPCKSRPLKTQKQLEACGKLTAQLQGATSALAGKARDQFLSWIDSAALPSRVLDGKNPPTVDFVEPDLAGCIDRLKIQNPQHWEIAAQIAVWFDAPEHHQMAAVGYYKAAVHLGIATVRKWVQKLQRWIEKGQNIATPGKLLMYHLNKESRKQHQYNISDLGTEPGTFASG